MSLAKLKLIWMPLVCLVLGALVGSILTFTVPLFYAKYLSIAVLAALDSLLGGVRAILEHSFDGTIMLSGFFTNALLAAALAFLGDQIGVDLYLAAVFAFGLRLFNNLGYIRRYIVNGIRVKNQARRQQKEQGANDEIH